jgi:hypothetical protein
MFKPKRKEKAKRGQQKWIALLVLLLGIIGGLAGYWFYQNQPSAVEPVISSSNTEFTEISGSITISNTTSTTLSCSYSQGFGSRENSELAAQLETLLRDANTGIKMVTVTENLAEYRKCGEVVEPIYQTCSLLTINLPIESRDPSEGELGGHIAELLDVLTTQNSCYPSELSVIFETPAGSITWQMTYALALEAYEDGARGVELYDPSARR